MESLKPFAADLAKRLEDLLKLIFKLIYVGWIIK